VEVEVALDRRQVDDALRADARRILVLAGIIASQVRWMMRPIPESPTNM
jgi:hypothetical protein